MNRFAPSQRVVFVIRTVKFTTSSKSYNGRVFTKNDKEGKKICQGVTRKLTINCSATFSKRAFFRLRETFGSQKDLWKKRMDHEESYENSRPNKQNLCDPCFRMGFQSFVFVYARYTELMQQMTGFGMQGCLSLHSLRWKILNDDRDIW